MARFSKIFVTGLFLFAVVFPPLQNLYSQKLPEKKESTMKIKLESVAITDLDKALAFYTNVLGFVKKHDIPMGDTRWVTVVSPQEPDGTELLLEPNGEHPPTKVYKKALYDEGIPFTAFEVEDIEAEFARLKKLGVKFRSEPQNMGTSIAAMFDDTNGNWLMIYQVVQQP